MTSGPSRIYSTPANGHRPTPTSCAANNATCSNLHPNHGEVQSQQQLRYISDLTFGTAAMKTKLSKCVSAHATQHIPTDDSLYMCLLVVSGHCYGPLDPVSNIILNAIWYDAAYPLPPHQGDGDDEIDDELPHDISDTRAMARVASRSLDGLVTLLRAITTGATLSKHEAVEYLWSTQCDLTDELQQQHTVTMTKKKNPYAAAAEASKHPQHTALGSFLLSLSGDGEKLDRLRHLLRSITDGSGRTKLQT
uniref:PIR2-like helical domain-containing protein n=1 Tax=Oryza nivara TaxID=4536 RepID=A0A0E0J5R5_ORYNI